MAYKLTYQVQLSWVGAGAGPMAGLSVPSLPGSGGGTGQQKEFNVNSAAIPVALGAGGGNFPQNLLAAGDITNLTNAMAADIAAQMNAALSTINGWPGGNP